MNILTRPWTHMFDYKGRSTRREFWLFVFLFYVGLAAISVLLGIVGGAMGFEVDPDAGGPFADAVGIALALYALVWFLAFLPLAVRRLHDHDKTGWFFLLSWFPFFGWIFFLIMMLTPGNSYDNSYGPDPRDHDPNRDAAEVFA